MKILIIGTLTNPSGAPIAALRLAAGFSEQGHEVDALFLYGLGQIDGGDFPYRTLLKRPYRSPVDFLRMVGRLYRAIRDFKPDAVLFFLPLASVLGALVSRICGVPVRIVSHRAPRHSYGALMRLLDLAAAWLGLYTDVVAVSKSVARSCKHYPAWLRAHVRVVYNGIKGWQPSQLDKAAARRRLGLDETAPLAVAVGRLNYQKNYPVLVDAMASLRGDLRLAIAGDGPDRDALVAQMEARGVAGRINLLGSIARDDIPHLLKAADIFVQPSLFEGQSNALLEALHAGLPCFVSDAPEQIETITDDNGAVAGAVLATHDSDQWARALDEALTGPFPETTRATVRNRAETFTFQRMMNGFSSALGGASVKS